MKENSLSDIYQELSDGKAIINVVPVINRANPDSDYLYNLQRPFLEEESPYFIQDLSIFQHYKMVLNQISGRKTILHYHWVEFQDLRALFGMPYKILCIWLFSLFGGSIAWTLHNESPHDQKYLRLHYLIHKWLAKKSKLLLIHCETSKESFKSILDVDDSKFRLVKHPYFPKNEISKQEALTRLADDFFIELDPDLPTLLMFGQISHYKNIEVIAETINDLRLDIQLIIAGPVKKGNLGLYAYLVELWEKNENIKLVCEFIEDHDIPIFMGVTDYFIFNYDRITSSGAFMMAMSYEKKIISPDVGCLSEFANHPNVQLFSNPTERTNILKAIAEFQNNV